MQDPDHLTYVLNSKEKLDVAPVVAVRRCPSLPTFTTESSSIDQIHTSRCGENGQSRAFSGTTNGNKSLSITKLQIGHGIKGLDKLVGYLVNP